MNRISEDELWLAVAFRVAQRSRGAKGVGAVIVGYDNRIIGTGYNGPPAGHPDEACPREASGHSKDPAYNDCICVHAELNALLYSERSLRLGGVMYVTSVPCFSCAKAIGNSGIDTLVYNKHDNVRRPHRDPQASLDFLEKCGLVVKGM